MCYWDTAGTTCSVAVWNFDNALARFSAHAGPITYDDGTRTMVVSDDTNVGRDDRL